MRAQLNNPTGRRTEARELRLGDVTLYFSYDTCIAVRSPRGVFRRHNSWGPTTGRHINEMHVRSFPECEEEEFKDKLRAAVMQLGLNLFNDDIDVTATST